MKTYVQTRESGIKDRKWRVVDAAGVPVGRIASEVAAILRGKDKPTFTRGIDGGDFVIVVNAAKAVFTGGKALTKVYYHHTDYFGGIKEVTAGKLLAEKPIKVMELAVLGMLPRGPLGRSMCRKLKVYEGNEHPHKVQHPVVHEVAFRKTVAKRLTGKSSAAKAGKSSSH